MRSPDPSLLGLLHKDAILLENLDIHCNFTFSNYKARKAECFLYSTVQSCIVVVGIRTPNIKSLSMVPKVHMVYKASE